MKPVEPALVRTSEGMSLMTRTSMSTAIAATTDVVARIQIPIDAHLVANIAHQVRQSVPLVQCLTNSVVTGLTANVLLASGCSPAMVDIESEAGEFAAVASAVLLNLGTLGGGQPQAMREAARAATEHCTPWVLDPVAVGALSIRTKLAHELLELAPTVIRANASEIVALAGVPVSGRGTDTTIDVEQARDAACLLNERTGAVVAVSGPEDLIIGSHRASWISGGSALLTRMTGGGCALGALVAAFISAHEDPFDATVAAHVVYGMAAQRAEHIAHGPGSFAVALLDELAGMSRDDIVGAVR